MGASLYWCFQFPQQQTKKVGGVQIHPVTLRWPMSGPRTLFLAVLLLTVCCGDNGQNSDACTNNGERVDEEGTAILFTLTTLRLDFLTLATVLFNRRRKRRTVTLRVRVKCSLCCAIGMFTTVTLCNTLVSLTFLLMLCGDIESNPGPGPKQDPSHDVPNAMDINPPVPDTGATNAVRNAENINPPDPDTGATNAVRNAENINPPDPDSGATNAVRNAENINPPDPDTGATRGVNAAELQLGIIKGMEACMKRIEEKQDTHAEQQKVNTRRLEKRLQDMDTNMTNKLNRLDQRQQTL